MKRPKFATVSLMAVVLSVTATAITTAAPADVATIKSRQEKLRDMGSALKQINDELKKRNPDWENIIQMNVQVLQDRSPFLLKWFPKGTGPEAGTKNYALPAIWQKGDDFAKLGRAMAAEAAMLSPVAVKKDSGELRARVIALGKTCKACHDDYRSPDYEKDAEQ